jgi:hypothetical protein
MTTICGFCNLAYEDSKEHENVCEVKKLAKTVYVLKDMLFTERAKYEERIGAAKSKIRELEETLSLKEGELDIYHDLYGIQ